MKQLNPTFLWLSFLFLMMVLPVTFANLHVDKKKRSPFKTLIKKGWSSRRDRINLGSEPDLSQGWNARGHGVGRVEILTTEEGNRIVPVYHGHFGSDQSAPPENQAQLPLVLKEYACEPQPRQEEEVEGSSQIATAGWDLKRMKILCLCLMGGTAACYLGVWARR